MHTRAFSNVLNEFLLRVEETRERERERESKIYTISQPDIFNPRGGIPLITGFITVSPKFSLRYIPYCITV